MIGILRDIYVVAYVGCRKLSPKSQITAADTTTLDLFAKAMCIAWLSSVICLVIAIGLRFTGYSFNRLLAGPRAVGDAAAIIVAIPCSIAITPLLRRFPELQSPDAVRRHFDGLSFGRMALILVFFVGTPIAFLIV
jgi:hypothetical protein